MSKLVDSVVMSHLPASAVAQQPESTLWRQP